MCAKAYFTLKLLRENAARPTAGEAPFVLGHNGDRRVFKTGDIPHISAGCKHHLAQAEHSQGWVLGAVGTGRGHPYTETTRALSEGYRHSGKRSSEEVKC